MDNNQKWHEAIDKKFIAHCTSINFCAETSANAGHKKPATLATKSAKVNE